VDFFVIIIKSEKSLPTCPQQNDHNRTARQQPQGCLEHDLFRCVLFTITLIV